MKKSSNVVKVDLFKYLLDDDKYCTCIGVSDFRYKKRYENITIPETITYNGDTYIVKDLFYRSFSGIECKTVILPKTLKRIYPESFSYCDELRYVFIPKSVEFISSGCFSKCPKLAEIEFEGDASDIHLGMCTFYKTQYIKDLQNKIDHETNIELENGYIGKNLVAIESNIESLYIKPGTRYVCVENTSAPLKSIYVPTGLEILKISHEKAVFIDSIYFDTYQDFIFTTLSTNFGFSKLYIGGKLITEINLPENTESFSLNKLYWFDNIRGLKINPKINKLESPYVVDKPRWEKNQLNLENLYIPDLERVEFAAFYGSVNNLYVRSKTFTEHFYKFHNFYYKNLTLYIEPEDIQKLNNRLRGITTLREVKTIHLVPIRELSSEDLFLVLENLNNVLYHNSAIKFILDDDFLKITEDKFSHSIKGKEFLVRSEVFEIFKCHKCWKNYNISGIDLTREFLHLPKVRENNKEYTCSVDVNILNDENSYSGIIKIPSKISKDGKIYEINGLVDFAFSNCPYLDEVIMSKDIEINDTIFFDSPNVKIIKL